LKEGNDMYYSSGNYEAFARPRKPEGVDGKTAWFVGAGLASMSAAAFLIRDGQLAGQKITILERLKLPGGALDGIKEPGKGFVIRGGREMEIHWECLWDLFGPYLPSKPKASACLTSSTGSTRTIRTADQVISGRVNLAVNKPPARAVPVSCPARRRWPR